MKVQGQVLTIDLDSLRKGLEARQRLKQRALEEGTQEHKTPKNFYPRRLVNTQGEKGRMLNMVA